MNVTGHLSKNVNLILLEKKVINGCYQKWEHVFCED